MKGNKGITLISLIITIVVMLILVAVSVRLIINSNILATAKSAGNAQVSEMEKESNLSFSQIEINGKKYETTTDYLNGNAILDLPEGWTIAERPTGWSDNVTAITDGTNIVPLPKGYEVSKIAGEQTISEGLVIKDKYNNEFVWIPTGTFSTAYTNTFGVEPASTNYDTQDYLDQYYGEGYYTLDTNFSYRSHYEDMVSSINGYGGFYVGRYETTINGTSIGSKASGAVLTADMTLKEGENSNSNNEPYYYRWWGLYDAQRNANVEGNGSIVQTSMIWGQQIDAMKTYFTSVNADYTTSTLGALSSSGLQNAGQAKYTYNGETIYDEICNIFDLRGNALDWTASGDNTGAMFARLSSGGSFDDLASIGNPTGSTTARIFQLRSLASCFSLGYVY